MNFKEWLKTATKRNGRPLSEATVEKYYSGLKTVSEEMLKEKVIEKKLEIMNIYELDNAIYLIIQNRKFIDKDKKGKKMYSNALKRYRCYVHLSIDLRIESITNQLLPINENKLTITEKESIIKARRSQMLFREKLLDKYNHECIVTKVSLKQILIASHIKPWAICNNDERVDINNGLLLSSTYDKLFDSGLITFYKNGKLKISTLISKENIKKLNINNEINYDIKYTSLMEKYLNYHNKFIFIE